LKNNLGNIADALDKISKINGIYYTQNELAEKFGYNNYDRQVGVIAQEIQKVLPEIIKAAPFDVDVDGNSISGENYITVQYEKIVPLLIEAIKEQKSEMDTLKEEIESLKSLVGSLLNKNLGK
jgi:tRNA(Phe) wybutosine-synthesizing methylase Tyw3